MRRRRPQRGDEKSVDAADKGPKMLWTLNILGYLLVLAVLLLVVRTFTASDTGKAEKNLSKELAQYKQFGKPASVSCTKSDAPHRVDGRIHAAYTCEVAYENGTSGPVCYSRPRFGRGLGIFAPGITCEALAKRWVLGRRSS